MIKKDKKNIGIIIQSIMEQTPNILLLHPMLVLFGMILSTVFIVYFPFLFQGKLLIYSDIGGDTKDVYYPFFVLLSRKISQGDFSLWDFTYGTGVNILSRQADVGNIFTWIACLTGIENIKYALVYIQIIKILIAGYLAYLYLGNFKFSNFSKIVVAYTYAFNGFMILWGQHYFMGNAGIYVILLLCCLEKAYKSKKGYVYTTISVFIILCTSYYFGYMILLFAGVYSIFRLLQIYSLKEPRKIIRSVLGLLFSVCLGGSLAAFIFLPSVALILNTTARLNSDAGILEKIIYYISTPYDQIVNANIITRLFSNNLLGTINYAGYNNYYEEPQFFFTCFNVMVSVIFILELFLNKKEKNKIYKFIGVVVVLFMIFNPLGAVIMNGFVNPFFRYTYILIPVFALCYAEVLDKVINNELRYGKLEVICGSIISLVILIYSYYKANGIESQNSLIYIYIILIHVFAMLLISIQDIRNRYLVKDICIGGIVILVVLNVNVESYITTNTRTLACETNPNIYQKYGNDDVEASLDYLEQMDQSFYRVEKTFQEVSCLNDSMLQGYKGITTYNSVSNKNVTEFIGELWPELKGMDSVYYNVFAQDYKNVDMVSLLGIKYILSKEPIEDVPEYVYITTIGSINIYRNTQVEDIGRFFVNVISYEEFEKINEEKQSILNNLLVIHDLTEEYEEQTVVGGSKVNIKKITNSSTVEGKVDAAQEGWVFLSIPFEQGWTAYVDDKEVDILRADIGFSAIRVPQGEHEIVFEYSTPLLKEGIVVSSVGAIIFILWCIIIYERVRKGRENL